MGSAMAVVSQDRFHCTRVWLSTDVAHLGPAATRHFVTAVQLGEGHLTGVTFPDLLLCHLLLAGINTVVIPLNVQLRLGNLDRCPLGENSASLFNVPYGTYMV